MSTIATLVCGARESTLHRLRSALCSHADVRLLPDAFTESDGCRRIREVHPDVVLLDMASFSSSDLRMLDRARSASPATRVLLFSVSLTERFVIRALQHGASGCLRLGTSAHDTLRAIRAVHAGELWAARITVAHAFEELLSPRYQVAAEDETGVELSPRQLEIVGWMRRGMTNKEIGRKLGISDWTVKTHAHNIFRKLEIRGRVRLCGLPLPPHSEPRDRPRVRGGNGRPGIPRSRAPLRDETDANRVIDDGVVTTVAA